MSDIAISVESVSKLYHIGVKSSGSLRETLTAAAGNLFKRGKTRDDLSEFWALRDVSFEVRQGEVVGVIGKNGAGKSTLLKILSRITEPTSGKISIHGRVGSLLEVGTGFHPELTGRENIFLNGSILGMRRSEIQKKFDEIVDFSGIEKFIDTPVKRYSSGMYVRLAFAVAAHLEPEILIIDEVLAVGDAESQKKCLGKMQDVAGHGRTVLFVSHNMAAVENLCTSVVYLKNGSLVTQGPTEGVIRQYLNSGMQTGTNGNLIDHPGHIAERSPNPVLQSISFLDDQGSRRDNFKIGETLRIRLKFREELTPLTNMMIGVAVDNNKGQRILILHTDRICKETVNLKPGMELECRVKNNRLLPGQYSVKLAVSQRAGSTLIKHEVIENAAVFEISPGDIYGTGKLTFDTDSGVFAPDAEWIL